MEEYDTNCLEKHLPYILNPKLKAWKEKTKDAQQKLQESCHFSLMDQVAVDGNSLMNIVYSFLVFFSFNQTFTKPPFSQ